MKVTTTRSVKHTLHLDDDIELPIIFEPIDGTVLTHRDGDKIVVGYLVQDDGAGCSPMEDHDGNGILLLGRQMDQSYLGLDGYGGVDIFREFKIGSDTTSLWELAKAANPTTDQPEVMDIAYDLYPKYFDHICRWAVPVDYLDMGSSGTRIRLSKWDGGDRVPNGVWVADEDVRANLEWEGKVPTRAEVEEYCKGVLEEYEKWCNGEVYGVVVEEFEENNGYWTKTDGRDNECWGFIGYDYAREALAEAMQ